MRNLVFKKIYIENFKCHSEIDFDFENPRFTVITGANGKGKTSIIDALMWAIYDVTTKGRKADSVIRKRTGKNTSVILEFSVDSDNYKIENYRKHQKHGDSKLLFKNGTDVSGISRKDTNAIIESVIMPKDVFSNCLLFSQYIGKSFTELGQAGQANVLDAMLDIENYYDYRKKIVAKAKEVKIELDSIVSGIEPRKATIQELYDSRSRYLDLREAYKEEQEKKKKTLRDKIVSLEKEISSFNFDKDAISKYRVELEKLRDDISQLQTQLNLLDKQEAKDEEDLKEKYRSLKESKIQSISYEESKDISKLEQEKSNIQAELKQTGTREQAELSELGTKKAKRKNEVQNIYGPKIEEAVNLKYKYENHLSSLQQSYQTVENEISEQTKKLRSIVNGLKKETPSCYACGQEIKDETLEKIQKDEKQISSSLKDLENEKVDLSKRIKTGKVMINDQCSKVEALKKKETAEYSNIDSEYLDEMRSVALKFSNDKKIIHNKQIEVDQKIDKIEDKIDAKINEVSQKLYKDYRKELENIKEKHEDSRYKWSREISSLRKKESSIRSKIDSEEQKHRDYQQAQNSLGYAKEQLTQETNSKEAKDIENDIKQIDDKLTHYEKELLTFEHNISKFERKLEILEFWKKAFSDSGIKAILLDDIVPLMNRKARELSNMTECLRVRFDSQAAIKSGEMRNKFSVNVLNSTNLTDDREDFSAGEGKLVDIITLMSLRYSLEVMQDTTFNIYLFDEILDSLDPANVDTVIRMLRQLSTNHCVVLISHTLRDRIECDEHLPM